VIDEIDMASSTARVESVEDASGAALPTEPRRSAELMPETGSDARLLVTN
jgi:hypothetical protein